MAKKFLLFPPHEDEEKKKLSICWELRAGKDTQEYHILDRNLCGTCRVFLMSDRFLGERFNKLTSIPRNKYPYVVIANTAGCNLDCWFCYAFKMLKKGDYDKLKPAFVSPENLAKCFLCKMGYAAEYRTEVNRYPIFSRVRITGGEPLTSSTDTLIDYRGDLYEGTVQFWRLFFIELDRGIRTLVADDRIRLVPEEDIRSLLRLGRFEKPTWVTKKRSRITIRFDTNGLLFCNRRNASEFLGAVCDLNKDTCSSMLYIELDYSVKGATPEEFEWSRRHGLSSLYQETPKHSDIEKHPQFAGIKNIIEILNEKTKEDPRLNDCVCLTVEKGIENHVGKCYLYHENSLQWKEFQDKMNEKMVLIKPFQLSEVKNTIQWTKEYGPRIYLRRYLDRGAKVVLKCGSQSFECHPEDPKSTLEELIGLKKKLEAEGKDCILFLVPVESAQKTMGNFQIKTEST